MTNKCLVTKLKSVVNNDNLEVMNALTIVNKAVEGTPKCGNNVIRLISDEAITVKSKDGSNCLQWAANYNMADDIPSTGYVNEVTLPSAIGGYVCIANVDCEILVENKYKINTIMNLGGSSYTKNFVFKDISQLDYNSELATLYFMNIQGNGVLNFKENAPLSLLNIGQIETRSDIAINIESLPANNYQEINLSGTKCFGDVATLLRKLNSAGNWVIGTINFLSTEVTGTAESIIMALKEAGKYEQSMYLNSYVTLKGEMLLLEGNRLFKSTDNGVTYDVIKVADSSVINTYNTETGTWAN